MLSVALATCTCGGWRGGRSDGVLSVDQLLDDASGYSSQTVDIRGEMVREYHGTALCDESGTDGAFYISAGRSLSEAGF